MLLAGRRDSCPAWAYAEADRSAGRDVEFGIEPRGEPFDGGVVDSELEGLTITGPPAPSQAIAARP